MNEYSSETIRSVSEMKKDIQVRASILCADFTKLGDEIKKCEDAGVDMIHVDVMDGHFVPNITIGPVIIESTRPLTKLPIEAHLMIENPGRYIGAFMDAGADIITINKLRKSEGSPLPRTLLRQDAYLLGFVEQAREVD